MGRQGPGRVWGSAPLGEPGRLPEKNKFLTLSVYDFKLKKTNITVCVSIFCGTFFSESKNFKILIFSISKFSKILNFSIRIKSSTHVSGVFAGNFKFRPIVRF
jgi:hypothetical protein